jgi:RND family efflux transporter MFP subunit
MYDPRGTDENAALANVEGRLAEAVAPEDKGGFKFSLRTAVLVAPIVALVLGATFVTLRTKRGAAQPDTAPTGVPVIPTTGPVTMLHKSDGPSDFPGVLLPPDTLEMTSMEGGKLKSINVKLGDMVKAGTVLAAFDTRDLEQQIKIAEAGYRAAGASAAQAGIQSRAASQVSRRLNGVAVTSGGETFGVASKAELEAARVQAAAAAAGGAAAGANAQQGLARVDQLKIQLANAELKAPWDGVVSAVYASPGMLIRGGQPVVRIIGLGGLRISFAVPEERTTVVRVGALVSIKTDMGVMRGTVNEVAGEIEPNSRMLFVKGVVDGSASWRNEDKATLAGRVARVDLL